MSFRTLVEDTVYRGGGLFTGLVGAWRGASPTGRKVVIALVLVLVLLWRFGPRLGLYGDKPGGFTDEEMRLIKRAGATGGATNELPWWYRKGE